MLIMDFVVIVDRNYVQQELYSIMILLVRIYMYSLSFFYFRIDSYELYGADRIMP